MLNLTSEERVERAQQMEIACRAQLEKNEANNRVLLALETFFQRVGAHDEALCNEPLDLSGLDLTELPKLTLSAIHLGVPYLILSGNPRLVDLDSIREAPLEVRSAIIGHALESEDMEMRHHVLKEIKSACEGSFDSLCLPMDGWDQPPIFIQLLPELKKLNVINGVSLRNLLTIRNMPLLDTLIVADAHNLTELGLANLPSLNKLELSSFHQLTTLEGVESLPSVKKIRINDFPLLENLASLKGLPKLEKLSLEAVQSLSSLDGLENLPSLTRLDLEGDNKLITLEVVEKLPALRLLLIPNSSPDSLLESLKGLSPREGLNVMRRLGDGVVKIGHFVEQIGSITTDATEQISSGILFIDDLQKPGFLDTPRTTGGGVDDEWGLK